jgi:hypothetical protein
MNCIMISAAKMDNFLFGNSPPTTPPNTSFDCFQPPGSLLHCNHLNIFKGVNDV